MDPDSNWTLFVERFPVLAFEASDTDFIAANFQQRYSKLSKRQVLTLVWSLTGVV